MDSENIKILFHFLGEDFDLMEVKNLGMPETAAKSEVYQWFLLDKEPNKNKTPLVFCSMEGNSRTFTEGVLEFDDEEGVFQTSKGRSWKLKRVNSIK